MDIKDLSSNKGNILEGVCIIKPIVFEDNRGFFYQSWNQKLFNKTVGEELLIPTKIYVNDLLPLIKKELINSIAHITGGGIFENLSRAVPKNLKGIINTKDFKIPKIFHWLKKLANISPQEMLSTFNCGIGVIIIIKKDNYKKVLDHLMNNKVKFCLLGEIKNNSKKKSNVVIRKFGEWNII